jgi:predicted RNA binding protein YcfA (HicA-like mRNA interferase family)
MTRNPYRDLARQAAAQGWTIRRTKSSHLIWISPTGARVVTSSTPSDTRAVRNHRARLKRAGLVVTP